MAKKTLYNWDNAPEWATYAAMNKVEEEKQGFWHRNEPADYSKDYAKNNRWKSTGSIQLILNKDILDKAVKCKNSLEKRPESQVLYEWSKVPEWANWAALDFVNGKNVGFWYKQKPVLVEYCGGDWRWDTAGNHCSFENTGSSILNSKITYKNSLRKRPTPTVDECLEKLSKHKNTHTLQGKEVDIFHKEASLELIEEEGKISYIKSYPYIQCNIILKLGSKVFFACGKTRKDITDEWNENTDRVKGRAVQAMLFALQNKRIPRKLVWCEYWEKK